MSLKKLLNVTALVAVCFFTNSAIAQNLIITPSRVVFDNNKRKDEVIINNPSNDTQTYRVTFENKRMLEDGRYEDLKTDEPDGMYARDIIRYSPRSFTLAPHSSQTVRLQLRKPDGLKEGEYRSHMRVSVVPPTEAPSVTKATSVNIKVQVFYGITIPVIVRNGANLSYKIDFTDVKLLVDPDGSHVLTMKLEREGNRSVFGDLVVNHIDASGKTTIIKLLPGVSVFTPNAFRRFDLTLEIPAGVDISKGKLEIKYTDRETGKVAALKSINL